MFNKYRGPIGFTTLSSSVSRSLNAGAKSPRIHNQPKIISFGGFDVSKLVPAFGYFGPEATRGLRFWIAGSPCSAIIGRKKNGELKDKSTVGDNTQHKCMRTFEVSWTWVNSEGFNPYVKTAYKNLLADGVALSPSVIKLIIKKYGNNRSPGMLFTSFNSWLVEGLSPNVFRSKINDHQIQYSAITTTNPYLKVNRSDFTGLVHDCNYFAMYKGDVYSGEEYRKSPLIIDTLPGIPASTVKKLFEQLENSEIKAIIYVTHMGIYLADTYEFNGTQYLGTFNLALKKPDSDPLTFNLFTHDYNSMRFNRKLHDAGFGSRRYPYEPNQNINWPHNNLKAIIVNNRMFRQYRAERGRGGDFLIFTPIKLESKRKLIAVPN